MTWTTDILDHLAKLAAAGYHAGDAPATEPTALAAIALAVHGRAEAAVRAADALAGQQADDGSLGVRMGEPTPNWPTSLALAAWCVLRKAGTPRPSDQYRVPIDKAVGWLLADGGVPLEQLPEYGHNTTLVGWPWAAGTHSWLEPTSLAVLALRMAGQGGHPRVLEAEALLLDRIIPGGGWNYGNTVVLGQTLRPHVQPTGIALLALAALGRSPAPLLPVAKSIAWLRRSLSPATTPLSLSWALLGLKAHAAAPLASDAWLAAAADRLLRRDRSPHKLALVALAAQGWPV